MDVYDATADKTVFMKYRLSDGQETQLLTIAPVFDQHISARNTNQQDLVIISTFDFVGRLADNSSIWLPFEDEIFALKLDGSGAVQRMAHHHSRRYSPDTPDSDNSVYWAEPHATASKNGDRILFGSNWRINVNKVDSIDAYVVDLRSVMPGDASGDRVVNALDITKTERIMAGFDPLTLGADANRDGNITANDITKVERIIAKLD